MKAVTTLVKLFVMTSDVHIILILRISWNQPNAEGGFIIAFKKDFALAAFENAITEDWQKTSEIAGKVGCCRQTATDSLTLLLHKSECKSKKNGTAPEIEMKWVSGGKDGTRAWRRISAVYKIQSGRSLGKIKSFFKELQSNCKHKLKNGSCNSKENLNNECNATICPLIIRR